jgi:hypothetical protein
VPILDIIMLGEEGSMKTKTYLSYLQKLSGFLFLFAIVFAPNIGSAQLLSDKPLLLAQVDGDDSYDPFSDYSEFDENSDEEADINFFRNGRFFTFGFAGGVRSYTGNLGGIYSSAPTYGLYLSYFFDLRLAMQIGFLTGDHALNLKTVNGNTLTGNVSTTLLNFDMKYYFSTQNLTRGIADLSPYIIAGFSQNYRTITVAGEDGFSREPAFGMDMGAGIEIPLMRKKAYLGLQGTYHYVTYKDENQVIILSDQTPTNVKPSGDHYEVLGIIGLNF